VLTVCVIVCPKRGIDGHERAVKLLRKKRMEETITEQAAAAAAAMSPPTARKWRKGPMPSESKTDRWWRTREDPFDQVWLTDIVPLLLADRKRELQAKTILRELVDKHPGEFEEGHLRTLQRRIRDWRAIQGPDREIFFPQNHPPGREGAFDFTSATELEITINGVLLVHILFVFRLSFSSWIWVQVAYGETFEALVEGLQGALWELGGSPAVGRSDNLSAATHELKRCGGRGLNLRFRAVLDHYGMESTRIKPGRSNENGGAEKGNDLTKTAVGQELVLRGSRDFESVERYESFVRAAVAKHINAGAETKLLVELDHLAELPPVPNWPWSRTRPLLLPLPTQSSFPRRRESRGEQFYKKNGFPIKDFGNDRFKVFRMFANTSSNEVKND